ncbi:hypothetical protein GCM10027217_20370 [Pseudomaricurvus hydrocarbonicus]
MTFRGMVFSNLFLILNKYNVFHDKLIKLKRERLLSILIYIARRYMQEHILLYKAGLIEENH